MALLYVVKQNNRKGGNHMWYGRAIHPKADFDTLCDRVQASCSMKRSDVKLVLTEFIDQMKFYLQNGYKVKWEGIGTFRIGGKSTGALEVDEFNVQENIKGAYLRFLNTWSVDASGSRSRAGTEGVTFKLAKPTVV